MRVLVLGGTGEARDLARRLVDIGVDVVSSLAGRVNRPALPPGEVRIGGFGSVPGLCAYLRTHQPSVVVDATHPFADTITEHAVLACAETSTPLLVLRRPGWTAGPGDDWTRLPDMSEAAAHVRAGPPGTVFLSTGRGDLPLFADDDSHAFVVRAVERPEGRVPPRMALVLSRGPYSVDSELTLLQEHAVTLLVTRDSGGSGTAAKLVAARELGIPVLIVDRPPLPDGVSALGSLDAVIAAVVSSPGPR